MYYVDIPRPQAVISDDDSWENIAEFETKAEAVEFAQRIFGADKDGKVNLITKG